MTSSRGGKIYTMFDNADPSYAEGNVYYTVGNTGSKVSASFVVPETNVYKFTSQFNLSIGFTGSGYSASFINTIKKNSTVVTSEQLSYTSSVTNPYTESYLAVSQPYVYWY
jgi:hypothetical protein